MPTNVHAFITHVVQMPRRPKLTIRYVPIGVLEHKYIYRLNDRPSPYRGRNDMETWMASPNVKDWTKISEMLLGPVPDNFVFVPKHKSNAYSHSVIPDGAQTSTEEAVPEG